MLSWTYKNHSLKWIVGSPFAVATKHDLICYPCLKDVKTLNFRCISPHSSSDNGYSVHTYKSAQIILQPIMCFYFYIVLISQMQSSLKCEYFLLKDLFK